MTLPLPLPLPSGCTTSSAEAFRYQVTTCAKKSGKPGHPSEKCQETHRQSGKCRRKKYCCAKLFTLVLIMMWVTATWVLVPQRVGGKCRVIFQCLRSGHPVNMALSYLSDELLASISLVSLSVFHDVSILLLLFNAFCDCRSYQGYCTVYLML